MQRGDRPLGAVLVDEAEPDAQHDDGRDDRRVGGVAGQPGDTAAAEQQDQQRVAQLADEHAERGHAVGRQHVRAERPQAIGRVRRAQPVGTRYPAARALPRPATGSPRRRRAAPPTPMGPGLLSRRRYPQHGGASDLARVKHPQRFPGVREIEHRGLGPDRDLDGQVEKRPGVGTGEVRNRSQATLAPQQVVRELGNAIEVDRVDGDRAARAGRPQRRDDH